MTKPVRIRLSRKKGFNLQRHSLATNGLPAVVVARPGPLGNPFKVEMAAEAGFQNPAKTAVHAFEDWLNGDLWAYPCQRIPTERQRDAIIARIPELRGFNLACWCRLDAPCHADVLLKLACEAAP
ncbi:DUF4326 domain-containing protein [uncultured Martelella sp.]|uniref:DUF4326 domain-containing protein n=1 Tax=uncultured Martelella sp. TaxID=392331 RepID=UPI0029C8F68D|nr:DUF4326 domain-containing protein [uncultured Martelella sp.]